MHQGRIFLRLNDHRFKNGQAARSDEPAADVALRVHDDRRGQFATIVAASDLVPFIKQDRIVDSASLHGACDLLTDLLQRLRAALVIVLVAKGGKTFAGLSAEKSWLVGILKNKIYDHYRRASRETPFTDLEFYSEEESGRFVAEGVFKGAWIHELAPREWPNPGESLANKEFWQTYRDCSGKLPKKVAAVFNLREVDDLDSERICRMLSISERNLWVMLHRARMALRRCLEINWFGKGGEAL